MLENIKKLLNISGTDSDELLQTIITIVTSRLKILLGAAEIPVELTYIITEVAVTRFNRIGSEGLKEHSVEGESQSWGVDDFAPYMGEIEAYKEAHDLPRGGRIKFL